MDASRTGNLLNGVWMRAQSLGVDTLLVCVCVCVCVLYHHCNAWKVMY